MNKKAIIVLPYAGGSSMMYAKWGSLANNVDIKCIEYAGHGFRYKEQLNSSFEDLFLDVYKHIISEISGYDTIQIFGHSMGALIAYKIVEKFENANIKAFSRLFVSGSLPPEYYPTPAIKSLQNDTAIYKYIEDYNRISEKKRKNKIFQNTIYPAIKNDFCILNNYLETEKTKIHTPITCIFSPEDSLMEHRYMTAWCNRSNNVTFVKAKGDHFYIEEQPQRDYIINYIINSI